MNKITTVMPHGLKDLLKKEAEAMKNEKRTNTVGNEVKKTTGPVQGTGNGANDGTVKNAGVDDQVLKNMGSIPEFDMILGQGVYFSRDDYKTQLNNNVCVVGTSGAGKTRSIVKPNLIQAKGSYVVSDPKGNLAKEFGPYLEEKGYEVVKMDFIHPERSIGYNPLDYCRTTQEIQKLAHMLVYELGFGDSDRHTIDPFWDETTQILLMSLIGYIKESDDLPDEKRSLSFISELIRESKNEDRFSSANESGKRKNDLDYRMDKLRTKSELEGRESWAVNRFDDFSTAPPRTYHTILISTLGKLASFDTIEVRKMLMGKCFDFRRVGQRPMAVFVEVSDTDRSMDVLVNLFYSQLMNELCRFADEECENSRLPVPVQFILDDFATNARIDNFHNMIANIRSRGISAMIMLQSESQLKACYEDNAQTIVDNCNTYVYMGGSNPQQAEIVGRRANKVATTILNMPVGKSWIFRRGQEPILCDNFDLEAFRKIKGLVKDEQHVKDGQPVKDGQLVKDGHDGSEVEVEGHSE